MHTKLAIEGMTCQHCQQTVTESLMAVAGVQKAEVSLESASAEVEHADSVSGDDLAAAVTGRGFAAQTVGG